MPLEQPGLSAPGGAPVGTMKVEDIGLAAISLSARIPDFWTDQPRVWFIQLEAVVAPQKVSDATKFNLVISKLGKEVIQQVTDVLVNPPEGRKYDVLKARLLTVYEESESRQIQKLIGEMELGDQKPTHLLRKMQELARGKVNDDTLSVLWQNHLPPAVRGVLAATETTNLERLASIADKILENMKPAQISEVTDSKVSVDSSVLLAEIAKLSVRMTELERSRSRGRQSRGGQRFRSNSRGRSSSRPRRTPDSPDWLCNHHFRYRGRATKCVHPCSWKVSEN